MPDQPAPDLYESEKQRTIRVFISSTFRDMHAERDELMLFVFPELRKKCRERQVEFVEVDLRWGITEEESKQGRVLPICLEEIKRCKPYFIGLLGERYGWVPDTIPQELIEQEPWLNEHLGKTGKSVTELEILHGVLNNPDMAEHAFFYFRDPAYIKTIPPEKIKDFTAENAEGAEKLRKLKEEIRKSKFKEQIQENYLNPKQLGELVLKNLWDVIDKKFPIEEVPTALERERMDHEAFAVARQKVYIGRDAYFKRLDEHVASAGLPLVVLGESGAGKSALIANWVNQYKKTHPDDFMVTHFIGGTADSADYVKILRRIMEEIKERYEPAKEGNIPSPLVGEGKGEGAIPTDPKKVVEVFPLWLAKIRGRCILVLDALNQLEDKDNAPDLRWLPEYFPPNVRVILSTLPGKSLEALEKRSLSTVRVELLSPNERKKLIGDYLARFARRLSPEDIDKIIAAQQTGNPLYLKALLDELRVYGDHETLPQRIDHYLKAQTVDDLYEKILERYENDYEREDVQKGMVGRAMSLIWASRRGLSDNELLELLGKDGQPLPRVYWSPLYLAAEESLVNRSGLLNFFHDFMRKAVEDKYLPDTEQKRKAHLQLADYFDTKELDVRQADELPWLLWKAGERDRLRACLLDIYQFLLILARDQYELLGYWVWLKEEQVMGKGYLERFESWSAKLKDLDQIISYAANQLASFLYNAALYTEAEPLMRRALKIDEQSFGENHPNVAIDLNNLAELLRNKGAYAGAEPLCRRALAIWEQVLGKEHPNTAQSLNNLAELLRSKGDYVGAEPLCRRALDIREKVLGKDHSDTAQSLNNLAFLLYSKGDYAGAEPLYRRALAIKEKVLGKDHPDTAASLNNLALLLKNKGDYVGAEPFYRRALAITEKVLGKEHQNTAASLNNLAQLLHATNRLAEAEPISRRVLEILLQLTHGTGHPHPHLRAAVDNYAILLQVMGRGTEDIRSDLEKLGQRFGVNLGGAGGETKAEPSPKLRAVMEQLMRDPSKAQEIAAKLQHEDPALLEELIQWIQSQQQK